jgi:hypothetical protein
VAAAEAKRLARAILENGGIYFTRHALEELAKDGKTTVDAVNVLRGGAYSEAEWENGAWRHHAYTARFTVVIELESEIELIVITAWTRR